MVVAGRDPLFEDRSSNSNWIGDVYIKYQQAPYNPSWTSMLEVLRMNFGYLLEIQPGSMLTQQYHLICVNHS